MKFDKTAVDEKFCNNCIKCCLWPGEVFFKENELAKAAECLEIDERTCADTFFDLAEDRIRLKTKPTNDGRCIFVDENGCRVYEARPKQCRTFPFEWQRPEKELMNASSNAVKGVMKILDDMKLF